MPFQQIGERGTLVLIKKNLAETFKLLGNSAYGKTLEARDTHKSVSYTDGQGWTKLVNEPLYRASSIVD